MWIPLKLHGKDAFRASLEEKHKLTLYFYREVQNLGFDVGPTPQLSVCIYRYVSSERDLNEVNERLWKEIVADLRLFVSTTTIDGSFWLRLAILSFRTHLSHVELFLKILKEKVQLL
jgi:glutamate/tyrosine decarboxylase-like PLP-dependent enzyme